MILGFFAAYAFSRFNVQGKNDLLFFILSTRMLPAVVVTIPLFLMYRQFEPDDTYTGMTLLYTVFNLSLAVWLLKGFIDEIPTEYEEAALIDGYSRMQAFYKIVLPQAMTGIAATTVFCPDLRLERVRLCPDADQRHSPHRPARHRHHAGRRRHRVVGDCRRGAGLPGPGGDHHLCPAQPSAARRHLWRNPPVAPILRNSYGYH